VALLIVLSLLFGGFRKGTKANGLGPARAPVAVASAAGGAAAGHQQGARLCFGPDELVTEVGQPG
jgi:hypothetical protein